MNEYLRALAVKYRLLPHIVFNTLVTSATWDPAENKYHITTKPVAPGEDRPWWRKEDLTGVKEVSSDENGGRDEAHIFISAIGFLELIRYPDITGLNSFKGHMFHSGSWNHNVDLQGKRVAVIGNGSSA